MSDSTTPEEMATKSSCATSVSSLNTSVFISSLPPDVLFGRFVRLCAALSAQEINYSQLGRDLGLTSQTARRWIQILKATFQWFEVDAFSQYFPRFEEVIQTSFLSDTMKTQYMSVLAARHGALGA